MRWFSLKGLLVLFSVWNVSQQMKDVLENIHPSVENSFELNNFLQDVMKMKKSFKEIRNAVADLNEDDDCLIGEHLNDDIDEYVYDAEILEANRNRFNAGKHQEVNNQMSQYHKDDRPSNDIYPHIYKDQVDHEYKNSDQDKGIRFRRQLAEDVQVEPKSSRGNIRVQDGKFNLAEKSFKAESTPNDARETLLAIFSELVKATVPIPDEIFMTTKTTPAKTKSPQLQTTLNGPEFILPITNTRNLEEQAQTASLGRLQNENKKNYNIKIMNDGKIIKEYSSNDKEKENSSGNDLSTGSTISFDIPPVSRMQNGFSPKIDRGKYDKNYEDVSRTDTENYEKVGSIENPTMEPETMNTNEEKDNVPIFVGHTIDGINGNYRLNRHKNIRPHSYNNFDYLQRRYPWYSYVPNEKVYRDEYKSQYNVNFKPQSPNFKIEDEQRDIVDYPANNEFYQLRRLQSANESLQGSPREKRNIQEFLGMNNEDDYSEDLDFSTETFATTKISENEEEYVGERSYPKSINANVENLSESSMKNIDPSVKSSNTDLTKITTALSDLPIKYYTTPKTITAITENVRMKRARKYRNVKKRKKLTRIQKRLEPVTKNSVDIKSKRSCGQGDDISCKPHKCNMTKFSNRDFDILEQGQKISSQGYPDHFQYRKLTINSFHTHDRDDQGYKLPSMETHINDYNLYPEFFKDPRFVETNNDNIRMKDRFYQMSIIPSSNGMYVRPRYFHFVPFAPPNSFYQGNILSCVHLDPTNVENKDKDTFSSRKLMTNSDDSKEEHKRDIVNDIIDEDKSNGRKESLNKRTESDYGEEPDLSEGQTIKKHSKLKQYNKVNAPGRNFEDNYEFEESPNESIPESKEFQTEKNFKLEQDDQHPYQHSFKERLTKLKNKLFKGGDNGMDKAAHDGRTYGANHKYNNRIERQPEEAPRSYEHVELLNPPLRAASNWNVEPLRSTGAFHCPDNPSSQDPFANPSDSSSRNCQSHNCRWRFNPLSGTFEATSCPCDPCEPNPCPCPPEVPPPCNPCPCPTTCNPCPTVTTPNGHEEAYSSVEERSSKANINIKSPCACENCPCPDPNPSPGESCPCPPPPCDPCPTPCPGPSPCPCSISMEQEKLDQNKQNARIQDPFDIHLRLIEARDAERNNINVDNNDFLSNGPFSYPSSEHLSSDIPRNEFRQYPRENILMPNDAYKVFNFPETEKSDETNEETSYSTYDGSLNQHINICPYPRDNQVYPYSVDSNYKEYAEKSPLDDEKTNTGTQKGYENHDTTSNSPHSCACPPTCPTYYPYPIPYVCPHPHILRGNRKVSIYPSHTKRADVLDMQLPEMQIPLSSSDKCPCVFGYFLPCPHMSSSFNLYPHSDHAPHVVSDTDEVVHQSHNGVPWIDPEVSPSARDGYAQPLSFSPGDNFPRKNSYLACRPSISLKNIFLSQPDTINLQESPSDSSNAVNNNYQDALNQAGKNNKRSVSRTLNNGFPYSFEYIYPNYPYAFQGRHYVKLNDFHSLMNPEYSYADKNPNFARRIDFRPAIYYQNPSLYSDLGVDRDKKEKRKCPKPSEPIPPCSGCPPSRSHQNAYIENDDLAERARRVNEYLKNKFLDGQYSMNNMIYPRNKRQLNSLENSISENMAPVIRRVRRPHAVPRKPLNRKMPQQNDEKKDRTKLRGNEEDFQTESLIPYLMNENDQLQEEELYPTMQVDRKSRSFLNEEMNHNKMKSENHKTVKKKNRIELQDLHFAKEIIDSVIEKVNKNPNLKIKIGNALNKKKIYEAETNQQHHVKECSSKEQEDYEETKNLLRSVSCVLNKLVKKQIQEKLCEHLPGHLKNFLKHIVRPPKHRIKHRCNDKYHEDTFLFRASYPQKKLNENSRTQLEDDLANLLNRFNQLDDESKKRAAPVEGYIVNHLNMLKKIGESNSNLKNSLQEHDNFMKINEHQLSNAMNEDKNIAFQNPLKYERSSNNLDIMEGDLENTDLEKDQTPFEKEVLHGQTHTKSDDEEIETKLKKRDTIDDNYKSHLEKKGVKQKDKIGKTEVSDKYKKLVEAVEEVRCKRKNEEKIGEAFGKKQVKRIGDSEDIQHIIR